MKNHKPEISVAPMMDWTDRHCRYFHRLISPNALLYSEMITTGALLHGDAERFLRHNPEEYPLALQLGGSDPAALAKCAVMAEEAGYNEVNLNCGCPSDRVQNGKIGACLMREPALVADCMAEMTKTASIPVTVKCRIGIDDHDDFAFLNEFICRSADIGVTKFIIHARKAWLSGLSPKQNREVPPLDYERAYTIKEKNPGLTIILNGGLISAEQILALPFEFDGYMFGREAYSNPYHLLSGLEEAIFDNTQTPERDAIAQTMAAYAKAQYEIYQTPVKSITRHILGLYHQQVGAKAWKRYLSENAHKDDADHTVILEALSAVQHERTRHSRSVHSHSD